MSAALHRPLLRSALRRPLRTARPTPAAGAGGRAASSAQPMTRAQQGLSRVASAAGLALGRAVRGLSGALGRFGGQLERGLAFAKRQPPVLAYYSKVGLELGKIVFQGQKISIPPLATFQTFYQNAWRSVRTGSIVRAPMQLLQQARSLSAAQLVSGGVVFAECLGFFSVGEILGRFKLVGYRGETAHRH